MGDPASTRWNERYGLLFHTFDHESDRGCVLMGAALIDEALERLLRSVCRADAQATKAVDALLVGAFAPLGSFASRAQAAFAFGLLSSEMFQLVTKLRKVRNRVAHGYEYRDFQSPDMKSYLEDLFATSGMVEKSGDRRVVKVGAQEADLATEPRRAFTNLLAYVVGGLDALVDSGPSFNRAPYLAGDPKSP